MKKTRIFAMAVVAAAALSCAGCLLFTILDALGDSTDPGYRSNTATILFDNGTNERLTCSVNGIFVGTVGPLRQLVARVKAGSLSLEASAAARSWGPVSIDLPENETYTWRILPNS